MTIRIRRARAEDAGKITALSMRSKQSNGYDDAFMAACHTELKVTAEDIKQREFWLAQATDICGCAALGKTDQATAGEISDFFVDPAFQRLGIGRLLWLHLQGRAKVLNLTTLCLDADPAAVPFYQSLGFRWVRDVPSGSIPGRSLPHMVRSV